MAMTEKMTRADVESFRSLVAEQLGLYFEDEKLDLLEEVAVQRMAANGYNRFSVYTPRMVSSEEEIRAIAERLTVGETYFFRHAEQFRAFREAVVPDRMRRREGRRKLRILSAGCASGEEAYTLAILLRENLPEPASWEISIRGIDVNPSMVKKAARAVYPAWSLRETPADLRARYFQKEGRDLGLSDEVKSMVSFEVRNLNKPGPDFWLPEAFDVIFCRNVIMYFALAASAALIARIANSLAPGGFLFLGHAETLRGVSQDFHLRHTHECFYYQLRENLEMHEAISLSAGGINAAASDISGPVETNESFFEVIHRASRRIQALTHVNGKSAARAAAAGNGGQRRSRGASANSGDQAAAIELLQQEKIREAIELLRGLPPEPQADLDTQLLLAALLANHGQLAEAQRICRELLGRDELNAGVHYVMALCLEHSGDSASAIEHDQAAIYLDSAFAMPHLHRGLLAKRSADLETAKRELARAMALLPKEDASRILLFGGGFTREALSEFCRAELGACGGIL
jgi:chemotaxis protein methyltransferase CheR